MLVDKTSFVPLSIESLNFKQLKEIINSIKCEKRDIEGFKIKEPNKRHLPFYIEGYDCLGKDGLIDHTIPKGIEIRTPIRNSITEMLAIYHTLFKKLEKTFLKNGYRLCLISHHPLKNKYEGLKGPRSKENWIHEQGAVYTYGPDINIGLPKNSIRNFKKIEKRIFYYAPALVTFSLNAPVFQGKLWKGKSIRVYKRALTGPVFKYHKKQNRWEFKNLDTPLYESDIYNQTLLFLTLLIDDSLKYDSNEEKCRKELRIVAKKGWTPQIESRARELIKKTYIIAQKYDFDDKPLSNFVKRLEEKSTPSDISRKIYLESENIFTYLKELSYRFTNLKKQNPKN